MILDVLFSSRESWKLLTHLDPHDMHLEQHSTKTKTYTTYDNLRAGRTLVRAKSHMNLSAKKVWTVSIILYSKLTRAQMLMLTREFPFVFYCNQGLQCRSRVMQGGVTLYSTVTQEGQTREFHSVFYSNEGHRCILYFTLPTGSETDLSESVWPGVSLCMLQ